MIRRAGIEAAREALSVGDVELADAILGDALEGDVPRDRACATCDLAFESSERLADHRCAVHNEGCFEEAA